MLAVALSIASAKHFITVHMQTWLGVWFERGGSRTPTVVLDVLWVSHLGNWLPYTVGFGCLLISTLRMAAHTHTHIFTHSHTPYSHKSATLKIKIEVIVPVP